MVLSMCGAFLSNKISAVLFGVPFSFVVFSLRILLQIVVAYYFLSRKICILGMIIEKISPYSLM